MSQADHVFISNVRERAMTINRYAWVLLIIALLVISGCAGAMDGMKGSAAGVVSDIKTGSAEHQADEAYAAKDYAVAFTAYKKAAEGGNRYCQFMLASMYLEGKGTKRDPKQYLHWMQQSADRGYPPANYLIGMAYLKRNPDRAVQYLTRAADQNHGSAMYMLGLLHAGGTGVPQSDAQALRWFRLAHAEGMSVDPALLSEASIQDYYRTLQRPGTQRETIREIQQRLTALGYQPGVIDGQYGPRTRAAIEAFQRASGMKPDGQASAALLEALQKRAR
jgi:TPR repeat protein